MFAIPAQTSMLRRSVSYRSGINYYNLIEYQPFDNDDSIDFVNALDKDLRIIDL